MKPVSSPGIRLTKVIATISGVVTLGIGSIVVVGRYSDWSAERNAHAFCDAIPIGSAISSAIARAKDGSVRWWAPQERYYRFLFPGAFFEQAVCDVEVDQHGSVVRKAAEMQYD